MHGVLGYLNGVLAEAKRIAWAERADVLRYSGFVVVVIVIFIAFILLVDFVSMRFVEGLLGL